MTKNEEKEYLTKLAENIIKNAFTNEKWQGVPSDLKHDIIIFAIFVEDFLKKGNKDESSCIISSPAMG